MSGVLVLLRRLRTDRAVPAAVALTALLLTAGSVATWRSFTEVSDSTLRSTVGAAGPGSRDVIARATGAVEPGPADEAFAPVAAIGAAVSDGFPQPLRRLTDGRVDVVETRGYEVVAAAGAPRESLRRLLLTTTPATDGAVRVVAGRLPAAGRAGTLSAQQQSLVRDLYASRITPPLDTEVGPVLEVALTPESARLAGLSVGASTVLAPDPTDPLVRQLPLELQRPVAVEVVGLVEPVDPTHPLWTTDTRINRPTAVTDDAGSRETVTVGALLPPDGYADLAAALSPVPVAFTWRYPVVADRLDTGRLAEVRAAVARPPAPVLGAATAELAAPPTVTSGLGNLVDTFAARRTAASTLLTLAGAGLAGAAAVMLALLAQLTAVRRATATRLLRDRGASTSTVVMSALVEAVVVVVPAVAAGCALAWVLVPARATADPLWIAAGIAVAFVALLVAAAVPAARRQSGTADDAELPLAARRIVLEVLAATLALGGLVALRRRGVGTLDGGADPFLAAAPVLLAVAVAIPVLRLYPLPLRVLARRSARARPLVPFLGLTRAVTAARLSPLPLLALLLAVGLAAFATVLASTVAAGQRTSAAYSVGADYRLDVPAQLSLGAGVSSDVEDLAALPGVRAVAVAYAEPQAELVSVDRGAARPALVAVDLAAYADVAAGTEASDVLPASLRATDDALPVAVTRAWSGGAGRPRVGDRLELTVAGRTTDAEVVALVDVAPGVPPGRAAVVVDHVAATERLRGFDRINRVYLAGTAAAAGPLAERVAGRADITDRRAVLAATRSGALLDTALDGVARAAVAATVTGAIALVLGVLLTARVRDRELVLLRALGLPDRAGGRLVAVETAPLVVTGVAAGTVLGIGLVPLVLPGMDPTSFTGPLPSVPTVVDLRWLLVVVAAIAVVTLFAVVVPAAVARRAAAGSTLRIGDA